MAEPERATSLLPTAATTADSSSAVRNEPAPSTQGPARKLFWLATMGAAFGYLTGMGFYGEVKNEPWEFFLIAVIIGAAAHWFFDPIMEIVQRGMGAPHWEVPENRRAFTTLIIVGTTIVIAAMHHSLTKELEVTHLGGFIVLLGLSALTAGAITHFWARGARQSPPRVAWYGAKTGALAGTASALIGFATAAIGNKIPSPPPGQSSALFYSAFFIGGTGIWALLWCIPGLLGGLAIEKRWDPWDHTSPSRGVLSSFAALAALLALSAFLIDTMFPQFGKAVWIIVLSLMFQIIGWALSTFLQREASDRALDPAAAVALRSKQEAGEGAIVVPIDSGRSGAGKLIDGNLAVMPAPATQPVSPQVLLLRPTGSRLWALVVLVIALALGVYAYASGVLRTDAEIVSEIESKFQLDSGLYGKSVTAQSLDHVVTIAGSVNNGIEHTAAVQQASAVRGVKQIVDQVQIAPPASPKPKVAAQSSAPTININPSISLFNSRAVNRPASNAVHSSHIVKPRVVQPHKPNTANNTQKQHKGFFHFFKKNK